MGYIKKKIGDISNVPYVTFECDTVADVAAIDVRNVVMGSRCYVVDTGTTYALNSDGEWKEVPAGGAKNWDDLENKPFYEETTTNVVPGLNITWDGEMVGEQIKFGRTTLFHVSDITPIKEQLETAVVAIANVSTGQPNGQTFPFSDFTVEEGEGVTIYHLSYMIAFGVVYNTSTYNTTGLYLSNNYSLFVSSLTSTDVEITNTELKTLDNKFLPEALQFGEEIGLVPKTFTMRASGESSGSCVDLELANGIINNPDDVVLVMDLDWECGISGEYKEEYGQLKYPLKRPDGELYNDYYSHLAVNVEKGVPTGAVYFSGFPSFGLDVIATALVPGEVIKPLDEVYLPDSVNAVMDSFHEEYRDNYILQYENDSIMKGDNLQGLVAKSDEEYIVEYDGVEYAVTSWLHNGVNPVIEAYTPDNTLIFQIYGRNNPQLYTSETSDNKVSHSIRVLIKGDPVPVQVINKEALPEALQFGEVKEKEVVHFNGVIPSSNSKISDERFIKLGKEYVVTFDDVEYVCVAYDNNREPTLGGTFSDFSNYPFTIFQGAEVWIGTEASGQHNLSIVEKIKNITTIDPKYLPQTGGSEAVHLYIDDRLTNVAILHNLHYGEVEGGNYARFDEAIEMTKAEADELYNKWIRGTARIFVFESSLSNGGSENFFEVVQLRKQSINSTGTYYDIYGNFMRFGTNKEFKLA